MKVLCIGFPKTGTKSMNAALTILGYKVYDYDYNFYYLGDQWTKILTKGGTKEDFYNMYKDVDAAMDMPPCVFWKEILDAFPDTKLIFMCRKSEEDWIRSWERQSKSINDNWRMKFLVWFSPTAYRIFQYSQVVGRASLCTGPQPFYQAYQNFSSTVAVKRYRDHNTVALATAPKGQTLQFKLTDGWEPLCKFLGKDIPDVPFPHKNQRATVLDDLLDNSPVFKRMKQEMKVIVSVLVALVGGAIYYYLNYF